MKFVAASDLAPLVSLSLCVEGSVDGTPELRAVGRADRTIISGMQLYIAVHLQVRGVHLGILGPGR